jgi:hypothetical protein
MMRAGGETSTHLGTIRKSKISTSCSSGAIADIAPKLRRKSHAASTWRWPMCGSETGIGTMAVGLMIGGDRAELILLELATLI